MIKTARLETRPEQGHLSILSELPTGCRRACRATALNPYRKLTSQPINFGEPAGGGPPADLRASGVGPLSPTATTRLPSSPTSACAPEAVVPAQRDSVLEVFDRTLLSLTGGEPHPAWWGRGAKK